jgi:hypothetical protein
MNLGLNWKKKKGNPNISHIHLKSVSLNLQFKYLKRLKLKNEINENDYNEMMRVKWEKETIENAEKTSVHYQDIRYNGNFICWKCKTFVNFFVISFSFQK